MPSATETLVLFEAPKVHVFSLPPSDFLKSDNWDGNYIWSGALKFIREGHFFAVRLVEKDTNELFGECPIRDNNNNDSASGSGSSDGSSSESVQPATDSTRAFVLRVEEGDQFSYVGLLFDDRTVAYNFSSALIHRRKGLGPAPVLPVQDHTLAKDESITVDLFNKVKTGYKDQEAAAAATTSSSSSTTVVGNSHFGGEIPRVDFFSLEITTKGKNRRVKCDSNEILAAAAGGSSSPSSSTEAAAEQVSRGNSSNNSQSQKQASPTSSSSIDDIFGGGGSSSKPPQQQQQQQQPSKSSADALDDVFSGGGSNNTNQQQQSSSKQKDVLDALFG